MIIHSIRKLYLILIACFVLAISAGAPAALAGRASTPLIGNAKAGKSVFTTDCAGCHTLKAAAAHGTIGPDLDDFSLPEATLIKAVTKGGATVASKAVLAKYKTRMPAYGGVLSRTAIDNVAAFLYTSTHHG
jgi:mono/diheme cytochrome c family protein